MTKSLVVFINQNFWDNNIWNQYQIDRFSKNFHVVAYELGNIINPNLEKIFTNRKKSNLIKRFKTLSEWQKHFTSLQKKKYHKILLVNLVKPNKLYSFIVLKELTKFKHPIVEFYNNDLVFSYNYKKKLNHYLNLLLKPSYIKLKINEKIFNFMSQFLSFKNYFFLTCGTEKKIFSKINVIESCYVDYNKSIDKKKNKIKLNNYVVFLENMSLFNKGDSDIFPGIYPKNISPKLFYSKLRVFFDQIERSFNTKIVIAAHPKSSHKKKPKYFGHREVFFNQTDQLIKKSKFVLMEPSQAISLVIKYRKPALVIYDKLYLTNYNKTMIKNIYELLKIKSYNLNDLFAFAEIKNLLKVDFKHYKTFEKKYLLASINIKNNYETLKKRFL